MKVKQTSQLSNHGKRAVVDATRNNIKTFELKSFCQSDLLTGAVPGLFFYNYFLHLYIHLIFNVYSINVVQDWI